MPHASYKSARIIDRPGLQFSYLGVVGIVVFLLLRHSFDFYMGISDAQNKDQATQTALQTAAQLGLHSDTLSTITLRYHALPLYRQLQQERLISASPQQFNRSDLPVSGWEITAGENIRELQLLTNADILLDQPGGFRVRLTNRGRVTDFTTGRQNKLILPGIPNETRLAALADSVFGYTVSGYDFQEETFSADRQQFIFERDAPGFGNPQHLKFVISTPANGEENAFQLHRFTAAFSADPPSETPYWSAFWQSTSILITLGAFTLLILVTSIRQIYRGRMEWKRALFIFGGVLLAQYLWQILWLGGTYYGIIDASIITIDQLSQLILAIGIGLYAAFAYVAWESLARELKSGQIPVIDAVWRFDFMKYEAGAGILTGYGFAGFYFAILALSLHSFDLILLPHQSSGDSSQELLSLAPGLSVFLRSWLVSMIFVIAHVGLIYNIVSFTTLNDSLRMGISMIAAAAGMFVLLPPFGTDGSPLQLFFICLTLSVPLVLSYRFFGIVSGIISWFVFFAGLRLFSISVFEPHFASAQSLLLLAALIIPFLLGLVSVLFGQRLGSSNSYVPAYEASRKQQLRTEKELAIAKESQFNLLPAKAPELPGLDVYGFFLPSYEVGGDFYDYQLLDQPDNKPGKLAVAIVDVSGKGMQAAFNAIFTSGLLLSRIFTDNPAGVLTQINPTLCKKTDPQTFITCQVGYIGLTDLKLEMANAGHCPPILKRDGKCRYLPLPNPRFPLGFLPKVTYLNSEVQLQQGDLLMFYSDGLPEAQSPDGDRMNPERLLHYVEALQTEPMTSAEICREIKQHFLTFSNYELADDTTLICIKVTG
ncbi:Serine phosphatase RsbU, regulator of sigma subunit [Cyclonatronum proteinivorum]|uniref:Serine phosphatase RsbU, regulator of sigma subunit n=1 Tax=Cyclonatronum proteinivorum TaxID=1457365 RepID=A0A345UPJ1_9BACT|nr:PP2C family protein-serine/threonine phosphatase [Cyclonatronum proteinivorum]AXJ02393.1 Serine phosphatase RsbU, regulator of sigma subunit [Cyclonatronum proteinivorum]